MEVVNALMNQNYDSSIDAITFGMNSLAAHTAEIINRKPTLSSSSSTSSTSSAASSSSSSQGSLNGNENINQSLLKIIQQLTLLIYFFKWNLNSL